VISTLALLSHRHRRFVVTEELHRRAHTEGGGAKAEVGRRAITGEPYQRRKKKGERVGLLLGSMVRTDWEQGYRTTEGF
jgi:hypothetical protein